jgi:hypothetical protein
LWIQPLALRLRLQLEAMLKPDDHEISDLILSEICDHALLCSAQSTSTDTESQPVQG